MISPFDHIPRCVITGCDLFDGVNYIHGDLHELGNVYVFNACCDKNIEAIRIYGGPATSNKVVSCDMAFFFERRGVIIFPKDCTTLNQAAKDYLHV